MSNHPHRRVVVVVCLAIAAIGLVPVTAGASGGHGRPPHRPPRPRTVDVQLLGINDFHGHIQASTPGCITVPGSTAVVPACRNRVGQVPAGGAAYLSTHLDRLQADNPRGTVRVASGDLIGASPLASGIFHDEPAIEALNAMGLQLSAPGNHEWDEGLDELMRMLDGGCHPVDGCYPTPDGEPFSGADFPYVATNIFYKGTKRLVLPPFVIKWVKGQPIAFIGADLEETPTIVLPSGVADVDFVDESAEINKWSRLLARFGVKSQVVVFHQGSSQVDPTGSIDECKGGLAPGPFVDEVTEMSSEIDVVMSGHSHQGYVCDLAGKKVISGSSFGRLVSDVDLEIDRRTHQVTSVSARNVPVTQDVPVDPDVQRIVDFYTEQAAPIANRVVGSVTADLTTTASASGEHAMGEVVADSQLAATESTGGAVVAFMNPGGVRSPILYAASAGGEAPGEVTYGELFTVQPFGNSLVTMSLTGAQIKEMLEQQWSGNNATAPKVLLPSEGFTYSWSASAPAGSKVDASSMAIAGVPVDATATYRVTVNSFLAEGGDSFLVLRDGTDRVGGAIDVDATEAYFAGGSPIAPPPLDRIVVTS